MPVPSSGPLSLGQIRQELETGNYAAGPFTANATALDVAENGGYVTINTCSPSYPSSGNPAAMSEWYGYDQDAICLNSYYAFSDGGDPGLQNMLFNNAPYPVSGGVTRPSPYATMSISFWMKLSSNTATQGYIFGLYSPNPDNIVVSWDTSEDPNNPGVYLSFLRFGYNCSNGGYVTSQVNVADANNTARTGVAPNYAWSPTNAGNVDATNYALITIAIDYNFWGGDGYLSWYWNDQLLEAPWNPGGSYSESYTYGDSLIAPNWTSADMYVGGSVPSELSSGCQLDAFALFTTECLTAGNVNTLYNGGAVATDGDYQGIGLLFYYNFENESTLGLDTGGTYGFDLDNYNNPTQVADPAK